MSGRLGRSLTMARQPTTNNIEATMQHTTDTLTMACVHANLAHDEVRKFRQSLVSADGLAAKLAAREEMLVRVLQVLGNRAVHPAHSANIAARLGEVILDGNSSTTGRLEAALRDAISEVDLSLSIRKHEEQA